MFRIEPQALKDLFQVLADRGYQIIGPTVRENVIIYDEINDPSRLPIGKTDEQEKGVYRLKNRNDRAYFGYVVGPHSWKKYLYPANLKLWEARKEDGHFEIIPTSPEAPRYAFIGVRACEIQAIAIHDRVFKEGPYSDSHYVKRRENNFFVAVNCTEPGGTCFCASMNSGPRATGGYDLSLTEIIDDTDHFFIIESGSEAGKDVLLALPHQSASEEEIALYEQKLRSARKKMGRQLQTDDVKELLYRNLENPYWHEVAQRCLSCANCTLVCPTCFCSTVEDTTNLTGTTAMRIRRWDSCFALDFSYIHGGSIRPSTHSRYRQWITHKLASWQDQFDVIGCVGCGRCITWCPVGIDITEEVAAVRRSSANQARQTSLPG